MSGIPSDIASSSLQAGAHAQDVARQRDAARVQQAQISQKNQAKLAEAGGTVETEDGDTAVFSDAEGMGGQGRSLEDNAPEPEDEQAATEQDHPELPNLDVQA